MKYFEVEEWTDQSKLMVGVLQTIKNNSKTPILHATVASAINVFVQERMNRGIAYVGMEDEIKESNEDEYEGDGDINKLLQDAFADQIMNYNNIDDSIPPHEAAFKIVDIYYDSEKCEIWGRIELLQTEKGFEAERRISQGMKAFVSQGGVEGVVEPVDIRRGNLHPCFKVVKILPTYKISFLKRDETFATLRYDNMTLEDEKKPDEEYDNNFKTNIDGDAREIIGGGE